MKFIINLFLGISFGFGLIISNIFNPQGILPFLPISDEWSPSILFTIGGMFLVSFLFLKLNKKIFHDKDNNFSPSSKLGLNRNIVLGSALFGLGWGLSGLCVSTATLNLAFNTWETGLFFLCVLLGFYGPTFFKKIIL